MKVETRELPKKVVVSAILKSAYPSAKATTITRNLNACNMAIPLNLNYGKNHEMGV